MKKVILLIAAVLIGLTTYAQQTGSPIWTPILEEHPTTVDIQLTNASESHLQVHVQVPGFFTTTVNTDRGEAQVISLPKTPNNYTAGEPDLPYLVIPSIIDDQAQMGIEILASKFQDFENVEVAPSKGDISRQVDPATVPYPYGACYQRNAFSPDQQADLFEPYILRDFRGQNMVVKPFAYNPVTKTLRVYYDLTVAMKATGKSGENVLNRKRQEMTMDPEFEALYSSKFINYQEVKNRYNPIGENGELLIICYESFMNAMEPFVTWKRTIGRPTEIVGTSVTGTSASSIQSYITSYYNSHPNLTHVLFVSDCDHIPGVNMSGFDDYSGYSDQRYGQIVGNDYYNDIFIGRFSANNVSQVTTQVNRTITYERDLNSSATWLKKGMGVSKKENGSGHNGEDDYEHIDLIRTDLLGYNYTTVYQEYAGVSGISSTTTTISNNINSGVGIINYCNHGSVTSWQSHNYSNTHVNSLTNDNKLPFIISTACLNGKYDNSGDCFAEAWMHATNNSTSAPTGAIGGIFSYISQPWIPPMEGQDEMNDILVESNNNNIKRTLAGVLTNGNMAVLDYSTSNAAKGTYCTWNIFGDPTLTLRTDTPANMTVNHPGTINIGQDTYTVQVPNGNDALATISFENGIMGSAKVVNGVANILLDETPDEIADLTLCVFGYNKVTYLGTISVVGGAQYSITLGSCEHGTFEATPNPAYVGQTVTLIPHPDAGYCLSEWHVTTNAKSQVVPVNNNQFVMPEGGVTVTATFVVGHTITLANVENGSIAASPATALQGATITLTATPASGYTLGDWLVYKTGDPHTTIAVNDNQFVMPDYDVTVMAFFVLPTGGEITIGSGSATSSFIPVYAYYKYSLSQQIYTASEINGAGTLTAIAFKVANSKTQTRTIDVYLKHTTKTSFSSTSNWETMSSANKVFSGSVVFNASGWTTITFDTPFEYNGSQNLMVCVNDQTGSWISSYSSFQTYSTNANRALYAYNDNTGAYNPASPSSITGSYSTSNNQIQLTKVVASAASLSVTPEVLDGFSYNEGQGPSAAQSFTIMGYVGEDITVTAPADYEISTTESGTYSPTLTLPAPNSSGGLVTSTIFVRLQAGLAIGNYQGETLTVSCGEVSKTLTLNGTVLNGYHWTLVPGQYADNMTLLGVILLNGEEQRSTELEVGAFCGTEVRGVGKASYCPPVDRYILPLMVYGNNEDVITFKLYDPNLDEEFDSAPGLSYLFTTEGYGSITNPENLNFYASAPPTTPLSATVTAEPTSVCSGDMATLTATALDGTGNYTYNWTPANLIAEGQGTANATTTALTSTTGFTCTVSDGYETVEATAQVTVKPLPTTNAGQNQTIAYGATANLRASNAGVNASYSWEPAELIQGNANQRFVTTVSLTATQTFTLTVTRNGCSDSDEVTVTVTPPQQSITLENGWKWFSSYLEYGENALSNLENSISASSVNEARIKSQTGARFYENGNWYGNSLTSLENENMYMVELDQILAVNFSGVIADPAEHPITLNPGWKWISFLSTTAMSLENALASITPNEEDVIKGQGGFSTYDGTSWIGSLLNLEPGKGYMYQNMGETNLTLVYPAASKGRVTEEKTELYWESNPYQYARNLSMMVSLEGVTLAEGSHEIGAFVNGECRGSARVKEVNGKVLAFLTVTGQDGEEVSFKVYDAYAEETIDANVEERILFASDALYGSLKQPYMLHLDANGVDSFHGQVTVFPNPSQAGTELHIVTPNRDKTLTVEVIDLLGTVIRTEVLHDGILRGMEQSGVYTLKVTTPEGVAHYGKLIINH